MGNDLPVYVIPLFSDLMEKKCNHTLRDHSHPLSSNVDELGRQRHHGM